jgi:hypothetical protein
MSETQGMIIEAITEAIETADAERFHAACVNWCALKCNDAEREQIANAVVREPVKGLN